MNQQLLGLSSSVTDIFNSDNLTAPVSASPPVAITPPVSITPVSSSPLGLYPVDLTTPLFADDFNRPDEILTTNIKWTSFQGQSGLITNQELNSTDNSGVFYAVPSNPSVFPDLTRTYIESSVKMDGSVLQFYAIFPYVDFTNSVIVGCFYKYESGVLSIAAGDYMAYMNSTLQPFVSLPGYPANAVNYVGCEVNQASGTAAAYLNSTLLGTTQNVVVPDPANSEPIILPQGNGVVADNIKVFSSFAEGRTLNDGLLRIFNQPYGSYYTDQLANFSMQGYCADNGATVQIKDASPGTFQSSIAICTNNIFVINVDLSNAIRFPSGANQLRIEYVNVGLTTEYVYNFSNLGVMPIPPQPPLLGNGTPTEGNSGTEFTWSVTYPVGSVVNLTPSLVSLSGYSGDCVASVSSSTATVYLVKVTGCTISNGSIGIKILAGSAKDSLGINFPASANSDSVHVVNAMPDFSITDTGGIYVGDENAVFRWLVDYDVNATTIALATSHVQVVGANYGCSVSVLPAGNFFQRYVELTNCAGNGSLGIKILAGSASNVNGLTPERTTALNRTVNNPVVVEFFKSSDSLLEGSNVNQQQMLISLSRPLPADMTLNYSVNSQFTTATNPANYNLASASTVTIPAGQTSWPISYNYNGNLTGQGTKTISVALTGFVSASLNVYIGKKQIQQRVVVDEESLDNYVQISAGGADYSRAHTCGLTAAGAVKCWGYNSNGQLGDGTTVQRSQPLTVSGSDTYTMISAGGTHVCGIISSGAVKCWGQNSFGKLGNGSAFGTDSWVPVTISGSDTYVMISAGEEHTCGITSSGIVKCWGYNGSGQLGDGSTSSSVVPVALSGGESYSVISAGGYHTCGITSSGVAKCWGTNYWGQLGDGTGANSATPILVSGGGTYTKISASGYHTCGITSSGIVKCWGSNALGELGNIAGGSTPMAISDTDTYSEISTKFETSCGITSSGIVKCWGNNSSGAIGDGTINNKSSPVAISGGESYLGISLGSGHTCGLTSIGVAKCWGANNSDQLGILAIRQLAVPTMMSSHNPKKSLSVGFYHSCGIVSGGTAQCWGSNVYGQLANTLTQNRSAPTDINDTDKYDVVSVGVYHACGVTTTGRAKCWGANSYGQLGDGAIVNSRPAPQNVQDTDTYSSISASFYYTCGLTTAGVAKCWGNYQTSPWPIGGNDTFTMISAGSGFGCGVTNLGLAKCWGYNYYGNVGDGTTNNRSDATQVSGGDLFTAVSSGWYHACGITTSGQIKCWGYNSSGQLGSGNTTNSYVPVAINDSDTYVKVSAGTTWTCGITTSGLVKCWGNNSYGQLGDGTTLQRNSPVFVSDSSTYTQISAGHESNTCGVTTSGLIKCWGSNADKALGMGDPLDTLTPLPVQP